MEANLQALQQTINDTEKPVLSGQTETLKAAIKPPLNELKIISEHYGIPDEIINLIN